MSALSDVSPFFREALSAHFILMKAFNVSADCLFVSVSPANDLRVVLRMDGKDRAVRVGGPVPADWERQWKEAVNAYNAAPLAEREMMVNGSRVRASAVDVIAHLVADRARGDRDAK